MAEDSSVLSECDYRFEKRRVFFLIDSKSFYASVESVQQNYQDGSGQMLRG